MMMVRSITASRIHKRWCNSYNILDINRVILQGRAEQKLDWHFDMRNATTFDPILDMDEVLEFVSPNHSGIEWLDGPQEIGIDE